MTHTLDEEARRLRFEAWEAMKRAAAAELRAFLAREPGASEEAVQAFLGARLDAAYRLHMASLRSSSPA